MGILESLKTRWQIYTGDEETPLDGDTPAWLVSMVVHLVLLVGVTLIPLNLPEDDRSVVLTSTSLEEEEIPELPEDFHFSDAPAEELGANSEMGTQMAASLAATVDVASEIPNPTDAEMFEVGEIHVNNMSSLATAMSLTKNMAVRGAAGVGATGAEGAIDRLTQEILMSLEERKTLVVWLFDQSGSLARQRDSIRKRFEQIYKELGVIQANGSPVFEQYEDKPLLTSVVAFGKAVTLLVDKPTDDLEVITKAVESIPPDTSGEEKVFQAIYMAANKYKTHRVISARTGEPKRNVMFIVVSDEIGNDQAGLDQTVTLCRRYEMPVYVIGVPAPFGRRKTSMKYVPAPQYDQTPGWAPVDQGPESLYPERIQLDFTDGGKRAQPVASGFGPFALTRLCVETGGVYFAVHPNRNVNRDVSRRETAEFSAHMAKFFDASVMRKYRPDYVSAKEYERRLLANKARGALVRSAQLSWLAPMEAPQVRFVKRSEAAIVTDLAKAQRDAAKLEPKLNALFQVLKAGEADRKKEDSLRWQAGFDLAIGRIMAVQARTQAYNAMLAEAKRGLKFKDPKSNTWVLQPADTITVGSQMKKMAEKATMYLERVVEEHPNTPWAVMASRELSTPIGWKWAEEFTDLSPRGNAGAGNNNAPASDKRKMLKRKPRGPVPKL